MIVEVERLCGYLLGCLDSGGNMDRREFMGLFGLGVCGAMMNPVGMVERVSPTYSREILFASRFIMAMPRSRFIITGISA